MANGLLPHRIGKPPCTLPRTFGTMAYRRAANSIGSQTFGNSTQPNPLAPTGGKREEMKMTHEQAGKVIGAFTIALIVWCIGKLTYIAMVTK